MTATATQQRLATITLETACGPAECAEMAFRLHNQLSSGQYTWPMSVLPLDQPYDGYVATLRTARKRARLAREFRYEFSRFERADYQGDINLINRSKSVRQGRPMGEAYMREQSFDPLGEQPCERHRVNVYGVFDRHGGLCAYAVVHRSGELALVSQILGHGEHEPNGIIQLLMVEVYKCEQPHGGYLVYNRHDSGQEGLVQAKEWLRFAPTRVEWRA